MIGGNIDGSAGGQLFDLLKVVANPDVYSEKLKALETATAENKKFVELVGKADEILKLREAAEKDHEEAKAALAAAKKEAKDLVAKAKSDAKSMIDSAASQADAVNAAAQKAAADAEQKLSHAKIVGANADTARAAAESLLKSVEAKAADLDKARQEVEAEKAKYMSLRAAIAEKHKAFIESL